MRKIIAITISVIMVFNFASCADPIIDSEAPLLILEGNASYELPLGGIFQDPGFSASDNNKDLSSRVSIDGYPDMNTPGTYTLTYKVYDDAGNETVETRTVTVVTGKGRPVITLNSPELNPMKSSLGMIVEDPGVSAKDGGGNDLSTDQISSDFGDVVNINKLGTYRVTYSAYDTVNDLYAYAFRDVIVSVANAAPGIQLEGTGFSELNPMNFGNGMTFQFQEPGFIALDEIDGDITSSVVTQYPSGSGFVIQGDETILIDFTDEALSTAEIFTIAYKVTNTAGIEAVATRYIKLVKDIIPPVLESLNGDLEMFIEADGVNSYIEEGAIFDDNTTSPAPTLQIVIKKLLAGEWVTVETVDAETVDEYKIIYNAVDAYKNLSETMTRLVSIIDETAPILKFTAIEEVITIEFGTIVIPYPTVEDTYDIDLHSLSITINQDGFDPWCAGVQTVSYSAKDSNGNGNIREQIVTVKDPVIKAVENADFEDTTAMPNNDWDGSKGSVSGWNATANVYLQRSGWSGESNQEGSGPFRYNDRTWASKAYASVCNNWPRTGDSGNYYIYHGTTYTGTSALMANWYSQSWGKLKQNNFPVFKNVRYHLSAWVSNNAYNGDSADPPSRIEIEGPSDMRFSTDADYSTYETTRYVFEHSRTLSGWEQVHIYFIPDRNGSIDISLIKNYNDNDRDGGSTRFDEVDFEIIDFPTTP